MNYIWKLGVRGDSLSGNTETFSRLCGKRIIEGFKKKKNGQYSFLAEPEKEYLDFIIDEDEYGNPISNTSNPSELSNFFGANIGNPNYLTPVKFKKSVLEKYYQETEKYSVEPGYLRCGGLWGIQMDNHHEDYVCIWLGDLGRDLPYIEQQHWRQYNIYGGDMVSDTYFNQQLMCKPESVNQPDHIFKTLHSKLINISREKLGWELLLPLTKDDRHHMAMIRCVDTQEQKVFDDIIMAMTKIIIDSLNEKKLKKYIAPEHRNNIKGISKLDYVLNEFSFDEAELHIHFLRQLQDLRSKSAAHRKGSSYVKLIKEMELDKKSIIENIISLLNSANAFLQFLINVVESGVLVK